MRYVYIAFEVPESYAEPTRAICAGSTHNLALNNAQKILDDRGDKSQIQVEKIELF